MDSVQGFTIRPFTGLVNFVPAVAYLFRLNLPAAFSQPGNGLIEIPCRCCSGNFNPQVHASSHQWDQKLVSVAWPLAEHSSHEITFPVALSRRQRACACDRHCGRSHACLESISVGGGCVVRFIHFPTLNAVRPTRDRGRRREKRLLRFIFLLLLRFLCRRLIPSP